MTDEKKQIIRQRGTDTSKYYETKIDPDFVKKDHIANALKAALNIIEKGNIEPTDELLENLSDSPDHVISERGFKIELDKRDNKEVNNDPVLIEPWSSKHVKSHGKKEDQNITPEGLTAWQKKASSAFDLIKRLEPSEELTSGLVSDHAEFDRAPILYLDNIPHSDNEGRPLLIDLEQLQKCDCSSHHPPRISDIDRSLKKKRKRRRNIKKRKVKPNVLELTPDFKEKLLTYDYDIQYYKSLIEYGFNHNVKEIRIDAEQHLQKLKEEIEQEITKALIRYQGAYARELSNKIVKINGILRLQQNRPKRALTDGQKAEYRVLKEKGENLLPIFRDLVGQNRYSIRQRESNDEIVDGAIKLFIIIKKVHDAVKTGFIGGAFLSQLRPLIKGYLEGLEHSHAGAIRYGIAGELAKLISQHGAKTPEQLLKDLKNENFTITSNHHSLEAERRRIDAMKPSFERMTDRAELDGKLIAREIWRKMFQVRKLGFRRDKAVLFHAILLKAGNNRLKDYVREELMGVKRFIDLRSPPKEEKELIDKVGQAVPRFVADTLVQKIYEKFMTGRTVTPK